MPMQFLNTKAASVSDVKSIIEKFGAVSEDYISFLEKHDGIELDPTVVKGTSENVGVRRFIAASEIIGRSGSIEGLSKNLLPFAEDGCGNFLCIKTSDEKVYFWDHESVSTVCISDTFSQFLDLLTPYDYSELNKDKIQPISKWVDPDFVPEF